MTGDTSITDSSSMTKDDFVRELVQKLTVILKREFPNNPMRQKIMVYRDRINFAAPCCGDSATDNRKKRGNLILEGKFKGMYKCHNCGECMSFSRFFRKYGEKLSFDALEFSAVSAASFSKNKDRNVINYLYDIDSIEKYCIDREKFKTDFRLSECNGGNYANIYLSSRKQYSYPNFLYSESGKILFILNLTPSGKIMGMQIRHLDKDYTGPKYKTYSLHKIYETFYRISNDVAKIPEYVDDLSMIFNILTIDYGKTVTVLEGPMDSFLVHNSIALCGAGKRASFPFACRFLFDDDETGRKHAMECLDNGYEVFLWAKYKNENGIPFRKKWDVNDIIVWAEKNNVKLKKLDGYFSDDALDVIDI